MYGISSLLRASGGTKLIQQYRPIANKNFAANSGAYNTPDKVKFYYEKANATSGLHDALLPSDPTQIVIAPSGGIYAPKDVGLWPNETFVRIVPKKGKTDKEMVENGVNGEWIAPLSVFEDIAARSQAFSNDLGLSKRDGAQAFVDFLQVNQALGFKLDPDKVLILVFKIGGPTGAYLGKGKPSALNYGVGLADFPIYSPISYYPQILVPGLRDLNNAQDLDTANKVFDLQATKIQDPVGFLRKF